MKTKQRTDVKEQLGATKHRLRVLSAHSVGIQEENRGNVTQGLLEEIIGEDFEEVPTDKGPHFESVKQNKDEQSYPTRTVIRLKNSETER